VTAPSTPNHGTRNEATAGAMVGAQMGDVSGSWVYVNSTFYQAPKDATPEQKFEAGVRCLEAGSPLRARELIGEVMLEGYETGKVRFYWVQAMLSKRSYHDLSPRERDELKATADRLPSYADDR
jgi:hypothetical protein